MSYNSGIVPDNSYGKEFDHETEIEIGEDKFTVEWVSYKDVLIPENKTIIDTYIKEVDPEMLKKYGDDKILTKCLEVEEYNARD